MPSIVELIYTENMAVSQHLLENGEISFANTVGAATPKIVLLAAASHLESEVCSHIYEFYGRVTQNHTEAVSFVKNKAISRQYHTLFDWKNGSVNSFFGLFGPGVLAQFKLRLREDAELAAGVKNFCSLGDLRNQLVHGNFAVFTMEKTAAEVYDLYESACTFVDQIPDLLKLGELTEDED